MFKNIDRKIKILAIIFTIIGMVVSSIMGIFVAIKLGIWWGISTILSGCATSWISSFTLYGLGEMIENTTIIATNTQYIIRKLDRIDSNKD